MADAPDTERQAVEPGAGEVLSVSQLNDRIASVVQDTPALNGVRCIGEVTDLHKNSTALYFTLTDGDADQAAAVERLRSELEERDRFVNRS